MEALTLDIDSLARLLSRLLHAVAESNGSTIVFDVDEYWSFLSGEELFDVYRRPTEFGVGQLSDTIAEMRRAEDPDVPLSSLDLIRLGELLVALGQRLDHPLLPEP